MQCRFYSKAAREASIGVEKVMPSPISWNVVALRPEPEPAEFAQTSKAWLWRWFTDRRLTVGEQKICVCIYMHFNSYHFKETGDLLAWPEWETIMGDADLKRSCVHKSLRRLKELGAFDVERGPYDHEKKKRGSNRYIVRTSKVHAGGPSKGKQGPLSKELGPRGCPSKVHVDSTVRGEYRRGEYRRGEYRRGDASSSESKSKKEQDSKNGNPRGPTAPEKESNPSTDSPEPSSLQPACEVPRPHAGWRDRLDEPPLLASEERAALGRLAVLANGNGSGATRVSS